MVVDCGVRRRRAQRPSSSTLGPRSTSSRSRAAPSPTRSQKLDDARRALHASKAALLRESQRAADLEAAIEGARRPSEGRSEETKAAAEATPAAAGDAVDIEAGMAAFEARVAALNSQIEAAVTAEQRP